MSPFLWISHLALRMRSCEDTAHVRSSAGRTNHRTMRAYRFLSMGFLFEFGPRSEVVVQSLDRAYPGVLYLAGPNLFYGAFRDCGINGQLGQIAPPDESKVRHY